MPLLSVIIPCKDDFGYADACIRSIRNQNFKDWHCVIILDQSPEHVVQRLNTLTASDQRFSILKNKGTGIVDALNTGVTWSLQNHNTKYISRFDIDDIMPAGRLQNMIHDLEKHPDTDLVTGHVKYISNTSISDGYKKYEDWINQISQKEDWYRQIYRECTIASPNWMMRRNTFTRCGGFEKLTYPEDYDLVFRWYKHGVSIRSIDMITLHWREHSQRTSRNHEHYQQKAFFQLKLAHWVNLDYTPDLPIVLLGNNNKAKITAQFLLQQRLPFKWFVKNIEKYENTPLDHAIKDVKEINQHLPAQGLITFFDPASNFTRELDKTFAKCPYFVL